MMHTDPHHRMRRLMRATAVLLAPALAHAQATRPAPPPTTGAPAGTFVSVARQWSYNGCDAGPTTYVPATRGWIDAPDAICVSGFYTLGQLANGNYGLWNDFTAALNPAIFANNAIALSSVRSQPSAVTVRFRAPACGASICNVFTPWGPQLTSVPWYSYDLSAAITDAQGSPGLPATGPLDPASVEIGPSYIGIYYAVDGPDADASLTVADVLVTPSVVPEPAPLALTTGGVVMVVLGAIVRRRTPRR